jgi:hypothetical protein
MLRQLLDIRTDFYTDKGLILELIFNDLIPTKLGFYMNKQLRFIVLILFVIFSGQYSHGQTAFASEDELKQQALKLFEEDEFEEAYPLYSQLVSLYPKDANYNYRLGVCMLYASDDKEKAIPFLEYSSKKPDVEKEAIFYLAKAYHLNYRFDDAIGQYLAYMKVASDSKANKLQVDRQIQMCKNGKKLLRNITDLLVIEKKELSRADFYRAYDISDIGGKLLAKPDEESFRTALDKKKKEKSIIYLATNNNQVYFSSYGDDLEHGKDIYLIRKLPNGEWSMPQTLGYPVNTEYDEDFPFLHPNGKVLYFCSKGHNSMGGYDIFKTTLNEETNTWNKPVNLDFPINTPDDDVLYVTNSDEKEAYFSSARSSKTGKTAVFHINVERRPIDVAIVKGFVIKTKDDQALDVKITVKDLGDNTILGIYNAKENGSYLINLPNGGKFMYTVEATGFNTQSEIVLLPTQYEFKPLKQEISYEPGTDKLIVKNLFDEPVDDQSYLLALNFIKQKAKMEAGVDAANAAAMAKNNAGSSEDNSSTDNSVKTTDNTSKTTNTARTNSTPLSNDAIIKIAYDDAKEAEKEAKDIQEQSDIALSFANQKNELAQNKAKEATQLMSDANGMTDNVKKQTAIEEANQAVEESEELNQETVAAFNIAKKLQQKAAAKEEEAGLSLQYAKALDAAVKSKNPADALEKLKEQEQKLEALSEKNGNAEPDNIYSGLKMDSEVKQRELDKATQVMADIKQEIADNLSLIETLKLDVDKTKKEDLKKGLQDQIEGLKADTEQSRIDLEATELKVAKLTKEFNGLKNEMELVSNVVNKAKTSTSEDAAASVAAIDKTKLEQQVNEIKTTSDNDLAVVKTTDNTSDNVSKSNNNSENKATDVAVNNAAENKTTDIAANNTANNGNADNSSSENKTADTGNNTIPAEGKVDYAKQFADQVASAESITNPLEKENKKAELLKDWTAAITDDIAQKKNEVKAEKDKAKKKELNAEIASLEKELKSKREDEKTVLASIEKIKEETVLANNTSDNTNTNNSTDNNSTTDNSATSNTTDNSAETNTSENSPVNTTASLGSINETYSEKLATAEKIAVPVDREKAKADVLKDWSAAINTNIEKQKQDMNSSTDPEMKALLEKKIKDAEALSKEKETLAAASSNQVKVLSGQQTDIAANTTENKTSENKTADNSSANSSVTDENKTTDVAATNTNAEKSNDAAAKTDNSNTSDNSAGNSASETASASELTPEQKLQNAITVAEKAGTDREREIKKEEAYRYYIADVNDLVTAKQTELKAEKDKTKKKELNKEIAALQSDVKDKQRIVDETQAKIKALESGSAIASENKTSNSADNSVTDNSSETNSVKNADVNTETNASTDKTSSPATNEQTAGYTNPAAVEKSKAAIAADKEAEALITQANDLKEEAAEKTVQSEKDALYVKASELMDQADTKKINAAQLSSDANTAEFVANQEVLDQMVTASVNNKSDEVAMAEMMRDESRIYFDRAQKSRTLASSVSSETDKIAALEDAASNEKIALEKQKKATEIYKKANPDFVATVKTGDKTISDNAVTSDAVKTTDLAVNENKTTDGSVDSATNDQAKSSNTINDNSTDASAKTENAAADETKNNQENTAANNDKVKASDEAKTTDVAVNETKAADVETNTNTDNTAKTTDVSVNETKASDNAASTNNVNEAATTNAVTNTSPTITTAENKTKVVLAPSEKFERTTQPVYSSAKPIPVNEALPEGLIYKVQIGAFRNPISPEQFNGMSPITAETTPQGFTRYTAGFFTSFTTADQVKNEIRELGYKDAFVVVFLNGKRISVADALKLQGGGTIAANNSPSTTDPAKTSTDNVPALANNAASETGIAPVKNNDPAATNTSGTPAVSENIATVAGLFYTVQVGVYSQPVSSAKLYNIQPLYAENTSNGNIRYTTGIYNNIQRAVEARNVVFRAGVKDAYVTAYYQGKRISLAEAKNLEAQGSAVFSTAPNINQLPSLSGNRNTAPVMNNPTPAGTKTLNSAPVENIPEPERTVTNVQPVTDSQVPVTNNDLKNTVDQNNAMPIDSGIVFKVQIGAFKDEVPLEIANQFLKLATKGIKNYKDANGLTIYTLGNFKTYEEASLLKNEIGAIVKDAFIVAYNDGNKISVDEAKTLQNR